MDETEETKATTSGELVADPPFCKPALESDEPQVKPALVSDDAYATPGLPSSRP